MKILQSLIISIVILSCASCFSCSGNSEVDNSKLRDTPQKGKLLTVEAIDEIPDDKLVEFIYSHISSKLSPDPGQEYNSVLSLSKPEQAIYIIWGLEAEVNNAGFNQYYYNSTGQFAKLAPEALKLVGAKKFAALSQSANDLYENEKDNITKSQDGTVEGFSESYKNNPLDKFDEQFYKLKEPLMDLQIAFIRKNKKAFVYSTQ